MKLIFYYTAHKNLSGPTKNMYPSCCYSFNYISYQVIMIFKIIILISYAKFISIQAVDCEILLTNVV